MNELHTADGATPEASASAPEPRWPAGVDPSAPPHARDAAAAYFTELDELLVHLAAHPAERWVAYYGSRRIGFGADRREFQRRCQEQFPDGRFRIYLIDETNKYLGDTVV